MRLSSSILLGLALLAIAPGCVHPCCDAGRCGQDMCFESTQPLCCPRGPDAECHGFKPTTWQPWPCDEGYVTTGEFQESYQVPTPAPAEDVPPPPRQVRREPKLKKTSSSRPRSARPVASRKSGTPSQVAAAKPGAKGVVEPVAVAAEALTAESGVTEAVAWQPQRPERLPPVEREESAESRDPFFEPADEGVQQAVFVLPVKSAKTSPEATVAASFETVGPRTNAEPKETVKPAPGFPALIFKPVSDVRAGVEAKSVESVASSQVLSAPASESPLFEDEADDLPPVMPTASEASEDESDDPAPKPRTLSQVPPAAAPLKAAPPVAAGWKARS